MKSLNILLISSLCFVAIATAKTSLFTPSGATVIPNQYIVQFAQNSFLQQIEQFHADLAKLFLLPNNIVLKNRILDNYNFTSFVGFSAVLSAGVLSTVLAHPLTAYVEADTRVSINAISCSTQSSVPSWGLDRIDQNTVVPDNTYHYDTNGGSGVDAYIIDTGVNSNHADFGGRAQPVLQNFAGDGQNTDCNGHGTHVAGTVGSDTYGVAKKVTIIPIKVLDCSGSGSNSGVISGIQLAAATRKSRGRPGVANMSLGGTYSAAVNNAVNAAITAGVVFAVAAGNSNDDACYYSPSSATNSISVGATDQSDARASFSNFGRCVNLFAPGVSITSTWIGVNNNEVNTISGTSMASPHVAGAAAVVLSENPSFTPAQVKTYLINQSLKNKISLGCSWWSLSCAWQTVNNLLYLGGSCK